MSIIVISTLIDGNSINLPFVLFIFVSAMLIIQMKCRVFVCVGLNFIDIIALVIMFLTYYSFSIYSEINEEMRNFLFYIIYILNIIFGILWILLFFRNFIRRIIKNRGKWKLNQVHQYKDN